MTEQDVYGELTIIFRDLFKNPSLVLTEETSPAQIGEWNSFAQVNIILAIEDKFDLQVRSNEIQRLRTIGDFVRLIIGRTAERPSQASN